MSACRCGSLQPSFTANALQRDWRDVVKPSELSYILGNPPFGGKQYQSDEQKADLAWVFYDVQGAGVLDFVTAWYRKGGGIHGRQSSD